VETSALKFYLTNRSPAWILSVGLAVTVGIAFLERLAPAGIWALYLLPIGFVTWYGTSRAAALLALVSIVPVGIAPERLADASGAIFGVDLIVRSAMVLTVIALVRKGKRAAEEAAATRRVDPSTGLANDQALFELIDAERERADRYARPFTLAYVGIDDISAIGTNALEEILAEVALEIRAAVRGVDYVARPGEGQFAVLFPETGADGARVALDRLAAVLSRFGETSPHGIAFSVGAITWHQSDLSTEALHLRTCQLLLAARDEMDRVRHDVLELPFIAGVIHDRRRA
jgi:diguanylate cyclase (GGDEF)-like protein